jgi:NAD(P)-dependent dehydrogenase (short-subunit alcohol dehydrogenase family)
MPTLSPELQKHFATAPTLSLQTHPHFPEADSMRAYGISKAANMLRVQAAARPYGERGARINTISPGIIYTVMGKKELDGPAGQVMRGMISNSGLQRYGYADELAATVAFLAGPESSFITGSDILLDGMGSHSFPHRRS